jgi:hypothetical protein
MFSAAVTDALPAESPDPCVSGREMVKSEPTKAPAASL